MTIDLFNERPNVLRSKPPYNHVVEPETIVTSVGRVILRLGEARDGRVPNHEAVTADAGFGRVGVPVVATGHTTGTILREAAIGWDFPSGLVFLWTFRQLFFGPLSEI